MDADPLAVGVHLLTALDATPRGASLIVAVDDLQWADAASLRALVFAFRRLRDAPVMALLTCRTDEFAALPASLIRLVDEDALRIHLTAFDVADTRRLARALGFGDLDAHTARRVVAHTGGSLLYLRASRGDDAAALAVCAGARAHYLRSGDRPFEVACFDLTSGSLHAGVDRRDEAVARCGGRYGRSAGFARSRGSSARAPSCGAPRPVAAAVARIGAPDRRG